MPCLSSVDVHIIDRPGQPFLGSGETGQGPAAASIANAIANATGKRLRDLPLTRKRIKDGDRRVSWLQRRCSGHHLPVKKRGEGDQRASCQRRQATAADGAGGGAISSIV